MLTATAAVLDEVHAERVRQIAKWGVHDWLDGCGPQWQPMLDAARATYAEQFPDGGDWSRGTWAAILGEEFWEVLAEPDPQRRRVELIQLAATCVQWVEAIDRR